MVWRLFRADAAHNLKRIALTVLAIAWGTLSIVLLLSFGEGMKRSFHRTSRGLGEGIGVVWPGSTTKPYAGLPSGRTLRAIPTTHTLGDLARALSRRRLPELVHVYFHDTDLLDTRRRALLRVTLALLARRASATDLDTLAAHAFPGAPSVPWNDVARL